MKNETPEQAIQTRSRSIPTNAASKLDNGPAREVKITPLRMFRIRVGLMGTGFAHPKPVSNNKIAPTGSTWANGFKVNLPLREAVSSPHYLAAHPCANSCSGRISKIIAIRAIIV